MQQGSARRPIDGGKWRNGKSPGLHDAPPEQALAELESGPEGLSRSAAEERLERVGPNELPRAAGESVLELLEKQVAQPLIYVLLAAAAVTILLEHWIDAGVILGVVVANGIVGFVQEYRASRAIDALLGLVAHDCTVLRDGVPGRIPAREVVPGDVLVVSAGDKVAADARLLTTRGLFVDEALLTGESLPVEKVATGQLPRETALPERTNMVYGGTLVSAGQGHAVVAATAGATELGRISELVAGAEPLATPLMRKIAAFSRTLTVAIVALAGITFGLATLRGHGLLEAFLAAVALAVAAIPEGLPAIMTIALATGVRRMASRQAVIRHLPAVETLGSTTIICSDKTGTLTRSEMAVVEIFVGSTVTLTGTGYEPEGSFAAGDDVLDGAPDSVAAALEAALLCSDARLLRSDERALIEGDPTEGALVVAAARAGIERAAAEARRARIDAVPFESERRFMATLHEDSAEGGVLLIAKGAPEAIVARCSRQAWQGTWNPAAVLDEAEAMAGRGLRVLAIASKEGPPGQSSIDEADLTGGFELLGLVGLLDPPRDEAVRAVAVCQQAGIRVAMITGDHPRTAEAVARRLGIGGHHEPAITGLELERLSDAERAAAAERHSVFARVAPEHKLQLVSALQQSGEVVGMTGDGVNDAPALRQADIGIAMGISGTDVSKEAADMVLRDDNFATIEAAVEEGRRVYDNLIKSIVFILPTNAGEALLVLGAIALGLTLPVLPVQVLWINLVTAVTLALPLAIEALEPDVMRRRPRRLDEPVLGRPAVQRIALVGMFMFLASLVVFRYKEAQGASIEEVRTSVVATIVLVEAFYVLNCRSLERSIRDVGLFTNPAIYAGIVVVIALQVAFTYLPVMNTLFDSTPIGLTDWMGAALVASLILPIVALEKRLRLRAAERAAPASA